MTVIAPQAISTKNAGSAPSPPTQVEPAAANVASMLTAIRFRTYAEMFGALSARFAAAHDKFAKSLSAEVESRVFAGAGDTAATT